jgi:cysteine desulfurase
MVGYLDHAATTPLRPEARQAMLSFLGETFGNPSGSHRVARAARRSVEEAREVVAAHLGARPEEIVFTAGGTEADNLAVFGSARRGRVLCGATEHDAVLESARAVGGQTVPVDDAGRVDLERLKAALGPDVGLVSVMLVNNEVGAVQPLEHLAGLVRKKAPGALVHTDAVQSVSWLDPAGAAAPADLVSVSAHKFGGPQGVGALVVRGRAVLDAVARGGGQEAGRRSGTHNVAGIVGMAAALEAAALDRDRMNAYLGSLRDRLAEGILEAVPGAMETVPRELKVAGSCHFCFPGVESESLLFLLDQAGVCASAGSACASGATEPSHVLVAMGVAEEAAAGALRLSLGWTSSDEDVDLVLSVLPPAVSRLRASAEAGRRW